MLAPRSTKFAAAVAFLSAATFFTAAGESVAQPGPAPAGTAIADYFPTTGQIIVSIAGIQNWGVKSASLSMTGPDDGSAALPAGGGLFASNDTQIGELNFSSPMTYTDISLGNVAATNLSLGDLTIFWNATIPGNTFEQAVNYVGGPVGQPGDFNNDNDVLGDDFIVWQRGGTTPPRDAGLLAEWESNYGTISASVATSTVPEPAALSLLTLGSLALLGRRTRR